MAGHVGENATAEPPPPARNEMQVGLFVRPVRSWPEPKIVIQAGRRLGFRFGQMARRWPRDAPYLHTANGPYYTCLDEFYNPAIVVLGVNLRSHLRHQAG